jgi:hypothetical protein
MNTILDRLADAVIAKLTPTLEALIKTAVKEAVDESNADLVTDIKSIPATIGQLIAQIPGVGPLTELLKGL